MIFIVRKKTGNDLYIRVLRMLVVKSSALY